MAKGMDGIISKGQTKGKYPDTGKTIAIDNGKKGPGGKTNEGMLKEGRNRSKLVVQFGSTDLKGKGM